MVRERKVHYTQSLEQTLIKRIDAIVDDPLNIFGSRTALVKYCVIQSLPKIEKQLKDETEQDE